jgi:glycosyltransferase involved in cell wall biosynthesis
MKLITVVIPNYNCAEYLPKCLEHVVNQTYTNLEIIICDNGSTDNSVSIIDQWAAKDDRIKVLINKQNIGLINTYNRMFFEATGDYIMIMDSDDWCDLARVEKQAAVLDKYDVGCCLTDSWYYSQLYPVNNRKTGRSGKITLNTEETWAPATIMFRRCVLSEIAGFNHYFDRLTSYDRYFILEIVASFGGYYLDECLYHVWARPNSDHRSIDLTEKKALQKMISEDIYWFLKEQRVKTGIDLLKKNDIEGLNKLEDRMLRNKSYVADKIRKYACIQIDYGHYESAKELLLAAIKKAPLFPRNYQSFLYLLRTRGRKNVNQTIYTELPA